MLFAYFTLLVALIIETVGAYYSITGLAAIFSGAVIPILIMGASLEVGKVTAAVWLKMYWERASLTYKLYLVPAVAFLMLLTSMGIFGFLSKAHSDQSLVSGDSMAKVAIYDEKLKTSKDNIDANRKALKQMDEAVDQVMARSDDEKGADKAVAVRRSQQKERARLLAEIEVEQRNVAKVSEERAPFAAEFRKVESEVGPIKYIAALIYGDNPDANILERAVRWVIILIVAVFDPLALVLILAAQQTLRWAKEDREEQQDVEQFMDDAAEELLKDIDLQEAKVVEPEKSIFERHPYLLNPFSHFKNTTPIVHKPESEEPAHEQDHSLLTKEQIETLRQPLDIHVYDDERLVSIFDKMDLERPGDYITPPDEETAVEKEAKRLWKAEHPTETVKGQRRLHEIGAIDTLPWQGYINLRADNDGSILSTGSLRGFGIKFPENPTKGDSFIRVDQMPSALYKYNGLKWIEVDKGLSDQYAYDTAYIDHLIEKLSSGEYDPDLLNDAEREQVAQRLQTTNKGV